MRVQATRPIQELPRGPLRGRLSRQDQGDLLAGSGQVLKTGKRLVWRSHAHDAVVPGIAVAQLSLDVAQGAGILINGDKRGVRHALHFSAGVTVAPRTERAKQRAGFSTDGASGTTL